MASYLEEVTGRPGAGERDLPGLFSLDLTKDFPEHSHFPNTGKSQGVVERTRLSSDALALAWLPPAQCPHL